MDVPLEIAFHDIEPSEALEEKIRDRVAKLEKQFSKIHSCRVAVEGNYKSQAGPQEFHVRIDLNVPGKELVVSRDPGDVRMHQDPYIAVRDAFDAMEKQLKSKVGKLREETKHHATPLQGEILRRGDEYGFVLTHDGREVYFHPNSVVEARFQDLEPGTKVELCLIYGESAEGPQATTVRPIGNMQYVPDRRDAWSERG
jgi:ribosomal subunit interface protein